jgi:hypothetical protein
LTLQIQQITKHPTQQLLMKTNWVKFEGNLLFARMKKDMTQGKT